MKTSWGKFQSLKTPKKKKKLRWRKPSKTLTLKNRESLSTSLKSFSEVTYLDGIVNCQQVLSWSTARAPAPQSSSVPWYRCWACWACFYCACSSAGVAKFCAGRLLVAIPSRGCTCQPRIPAKAPSPPHRRLSPSTIKISLHLTTHCSQQGRSSKDPPLRISRVIKSGKLLLFRTPAKISLFIERF